ncbi:hypothetical protein niasHT_023535 [Heterodera trifolii]|uniref:BHLH domain-containing protein n=1 Tax=Heterodera trifolii TaxID=157864 RepID=A0ABD2K363_9BILA
MQQPPPVHASSVPSSSVLLDQHQLLPLHYSYALHQSQPHQGTAFPPVLSPAAVTNASASSVSAASFPAQFSHIYPLGGQIANFTEAGQEQLQKQQNSTAALTGTMPPQSSEIIETMKNGQQKQQTNGTTAKAEQLKNGEEMRSKNREEKGTIECPYGTIGGMFGAISSDYGGWMGTTAGHGLVTSYPPLPPPAVAPLPPPCPVPLGADELGVIYGPNGLMNVSTSGLHYEIDPTMGGYESVWTGGGYYLGADQQAKILADQQQYLSGASDTVDGRYGGGGNGGGTAALCANGASAFYSSLHQQGISSSALVDPSLFHPNSALPPAPSQLSSDPIYGQPAAFVPISVPPPPPTQTLLPPALSSSESAISSNSLFVSSQNGGPALLHQLDPSPSQQQTNNFYPTQFAESGPIAPPNSSSDSLATNLVQQHAGGPAKKGGQQKNGTNVGGPIRQNLTKKGRLMKMAFGRGMMLTGRPSSSQTTEREERRTSGDSGGGGRKTGGRARSVAKESSDDEKSTEEKEQERRNANNTRERIRVRDINAAFKELARLCSQHMPNVDERGLTKLNTLLKAVELIPQLEKRVEEKNRVVSARKECIKHRLNGPPICALPPASLQSQAFGPPLDTSASLVHHIATQPNTTTNLSALQGRHG